MKKVFIVHGYTGTPNGGWRPWLMTELRKIDIYACSLAMPSPNKPKLNEWVMELARTVDNCTDDDDIYLVGHSLGAATILRYAESPLARSNLRAVLVSGPCKKTENRDIDDFVGHPFDWGRIGQRLERSVIVHAIDDKVVPFTHASHMADMLVSPLVRLRQGGHLNGSSGCHELPVAMLALKAIFRT